MNKPAALDVRNLSVYIQHHQILKNISFSVPAGSTTAILGPNGAGKSILLKTILGLVPKSQGTITIFGSDHLKRKKVSKLISYIPQKLQLDHTFPLTVAGLFSLKSKRPIGLKIGEDQKMHELLDLVGLPNRTTQRLNTLSGGQLQRVLLAYSLMDDPKFLLLDEPSVGIDVLGQDTIYTLLEKIQKQKDITMLIVSHELDVVMRYASQVVCLNKEMLCHGIPKEVLSSEMLHQMYGGPVGVFSHFHDSDAE